MLDYLILTPSFNRIEPLTEILAQLREEAETAGLAVSQVILDDCSDDQAGYKALKARFTSPNFRVILLRNQENCGRDQFWRVWNRLFDAAGRHESRYYITLADDLILCRDFLRRTTRSFEFLRAQNKAYAAMNLLSLHPTNWGRPDYVDGAWICTKEFFQALQFRIEEVPKDRFKNGNQNRSSGVHQQITRRLSKTRVRVAPTQGVSWVTLRDLPSALFPETKFPDRKKNDGRWLDLFVDGV